MPSIRELPPLLVRADASATMGTGHVMRCLALTEAWKQLGGSALLLSSCGNPALEQRICSSGVDFVPLKPTDAESDHFRSMLSLLAVRKTFFVILDGYHFDSAQQQILREAGHRLMVIDDTSHLPVYHADILLNQNLGAARLNYQCDQDTLLLLGPDYTLLRSEFSAMRRRVRTIPDSARRLLVTLGGSDPEKVTLRVIEALRRLGRCLLEIKLVVGPANPNEDVIRDAAASLPMTAQVIANASDMGSLMVWADLAVTGGGTTCWELACLGLPAITIVLAENQKRVAEELARAGIAVNVGWHGELSVENLTTALESLIYSSFRRLRMSQRGRELVDGRGADRVVAALVDRSRVGAEEPAVP